ncbi:MAG: phosphonate C-P lyase [Clostridiaceae bacterium BRH_c20a]|nr:MAG: phosphonate C-P lyase [Clostridiaceae bacterium BRH_c20a]
MLRKRRTTILVKGDQKLAKSLAEQIIKNYNVKVMQKPENGLVMVKMRESSARKLFYLGELLVTECKVQINEVLGVGLVSGDRQELAYYLAVIDAACNAALPETKSWESVLMVEEEKIAAHEAKEHLKLLRTKVNFETMDV